jgi:hypothetical protein
MFFLPASLFLPLFLFVTPAEAAGQGQLHVASPGFPLPRG